MKTDERKPTDLSFVLSVYYSAEVDRDTALGHLVPKVSRAKASATPIEVRSTTIRETGANAIRVYWGETVGDEPINIPALEAVEEE